MKPGRLNPNSLFLDRPLTAEERAAHDEDPRPGVWGGTRDADLRKLSQDETDALVRIELWQEASRRGDDIGEIEGALGNLTSAIGRCQRGGIDSDPLVRLLAYRAWGDRDRRWFEGRGIRKGDAVDRIGMDKSGALIVSTSWDRAFECGYSLEEGHPGALVICRIDMDRPSGPHPGLYGSARRGVLDIPCRVSDRQRLPGFTANALQRLRWYTS